MKYYLLIVETNSSYEMCDCLQNQSELQYFLRQQAALDEPSVMLSRFSKLKIF